MRPDFMNHWQSRRFVLVLAIVVAAMAYGAVLAAGQGRDDAAATLRVDDLRCEYLVNPLGIDARSPRLELEAAPGPGRIEGPDAIGLPGCSLPPRTRCSARTRGIPGIAARWPRTSPSTWRTEASR